MADETIIKDFLVKLGFKQDEAGLKKFTNGVEGATKNVFKMVAAIQGASLSIAAGVAAFSSKLEEMYFASKRAGAGAANLKAVEQAAQNINGAGADALESIQALAQFIRTQPGSVGFLKALGVDALDAKGNMRDMADIFVDVGKAMAKKPYFLAKQQAGMLGISEEALRAMLNPKFQAELKKQQDLLKKSGFDKAAEDANKFSSRIREITLKLEIFAVKIQDALMKKLGVSFESLSIWMDKNGDRLADIISDILITIIELAKILIPAIKWVVEKFIELDKATNGWSTKILLALAGLKMLGAGSLITGILSLATAMGTLAIPILAIAAAAGAGIAIKNWIDSKDPAEEAASLARRSASGKIRKAGSAPSGGNLDPVNFFMGLGWTKDQASGIVANLKAESQMNPNAMQEGTSLSALKKGSNMGYGLGQWDANRRNNFKKWSGKEIYGSSAEEQMQFYHYEMTQGSEQKAGRMLRATQNARQAGDAVSRYNERPRDIEGEAARRGDSAVQISQRTEININGAGDAGATARAVAAEQTRVHEDMSRNLALNLR